MAQHNEEYWDRLDPSTFIFEGDFEAQVDYLLKTVRLTRSAVESLSILFKELQTILRYTWPGCRVMPFGSIVTGLGIKSSDVDCYVDLPDDQSYFNDPAAAVKIAKNELYRRSRNFKELFAIPMAKVPILKFFHLPTQRHCDVNFKSLAGVQNSKLLAFLLHMDPRAVSLTILIKYWAKVHHLTGTNLVPNYSMILLVVFYLQSKEILPSVFKLQRFIPEYMVDGWNTAYNDVMNHQTENTETLYQLLRGFFHFYHSFNFDANVVCPYLGRTVQKQLFKSLQGLPVEYELYKHNVSQVVFKPFNTNSKICIQDPFEHTRNCSGGVFPKLAQKLLLHFKHAVTLFGNHTKEEVLKQLLTTAPVENNPPPKQKHVFTNKVNKINKAKPNEANINNRNIKTKASLQDMYNQGKKRKR